jgi:amino acid permease
MRFRNFPAIWFLVALSSLHPLYFAGALSLTKRNSALPPQKQQTNQQSISLAASSSDENDGPSKGTNQSSSSVGSATIPEEVFNLVKSIIGAGVLSLPAGIALMADNGASSTSSGILLSTSSMLIALMGGISAYTFSLIARVCKMTNSNTYADCWKATKGQSLAWIVALSSTLDCFAGNLTYSMVLADTFRQLFSYLFELGGSSGKYAALFATLNAYNSRTRVLLVLTATILMPLCCVKNLSSLAPFSLVGILGMIYTAFVIGLRYFDGSYKLPNGRFLADLGAVPSFAGAGSSSAGSMLLPLRNPKSLILVSMLSTAYIAHFNAPKFYRELKDADSQPKRFHLGVVASSFAVSVLFYAIVSALGYLTFGAATEGMILSNYSTKDVLVSLSRFAVGLSLIFSYPLLFVGLREGIVDLINQITPLLRSNKTTPQKQLVLTDKQSNRVTVGMVSLITMLALKITDLTFVASMSGALLGTSLIFIFPPLMFRSALTMESERTSTPFTGLQTFERRLCSIIVGLGVFIAGVGAKMAWTA